MKKQLVRLIFVFLLCSNFCIAQTLTAAEVVFLTPRDSKYHGDDKDHDTKINIQLIDNSDSVISATEYDEDKTFPDNDTENEVTLTGNAFNGLVKVDKAAFSTGSFIITIRPSGNDTWIFLPTIYLYFSDGSSLSYKANDVIRLDQNFSSRSIKF